MVKPLVRLLPAVEQRVETGVVQFGDDWPGIFIRGDACHGEAWALRCAVERLHPNPNDPLDGDRAALRRMITLLESSNVHNWGKT